MQVITGSGQGLQPGLISSPCSPGCLHSSRAARADTRAPGMGAQPCLSLAFLACGSRDSLGIHHVGDFICQLHSHIFTT